MASWTNFGANDVSDEVRAYKDKLASKDGHIAAQQTQLMKQTEELEELKRALTEANFKLGSESTRILQLEADLKTCSEELRDERIAAQNASQALTAVQGHLKEKSLETRDLESQLERLSRTNGDQNSTTEKLQQDKRLLEAHVRELREELAKATTSQIKHPIRPHASSVFEPWDTALQQELAQIRASLDARMAELASANERASQNQVELLKVENEKAALERRSAKEIATLKSQLEEKELEVQYLQLRGIDESRERVLIERIEEDESKIAALEKLAVDGHETRRLKTCLKEVEGDLTAERSRMSDLERRFGLSEDGRRYTQDQLSRAEAEITRLKNVSSAQAAEIGCLRPEVAAKVDDRMDVDRPVCTGRTPSPDTQEEIASQVERLLAAVERLRGERDTLRRNVSFLETEHQFTVNALKSEITTLSQLKSCHTGPAVEIRHGMQAQIRRVELLATASMIIVQNLAQKQLHDQLPSPVLHVDGSSAELSQAHNEITNLEARVQELEAQLGGNLSLLESVTGERDSLVVTVREQQRASLTESMSGKEKAQQLRNDLERADAQVAQLSKALQNLESERSSLNLQLTNLNADLKKAQDELTKAETRYTELQFHQLSSMSSQEVNASLKERIKELEGRVLRRTEQIGIHQHDIRRMETNLKLQEERLNELTADLETMASQKEAMVEDCADAREARDTAIARIEAMEVEMEAKIEEGERTVENLVKVIIQTIVAARERVLRSDGDAKSAKEGLARLEEDYKRASELLDEKETAIEVNSLVEEGIHQSTLALAVSQNGLRKAMTFIKEILEQKIALQHDIASEKVLVIQEHAENNLLQARISELQRDIAISAEELGSLHAKLAELDKSLFDRETAHDEVIANLQTLNQALQTSLDQTQDLLAKQSDDGRMSELRSRYEVESAVAHQRLSVAEKEAEHLKEALATTKAGLEVSLAEEKAARSDLDKQISELTTLLQTKVEEHGAAQAATEAAIKDKDRLQQALDDVLIAAQEKQTASEELQLSYDQASEELSLLQQSQESSLAAASAKSEAAQRLQQEVVNLEIKLEQEKQQLGIAKAEVAQLSDQLSEQAKLHEEGEEQQQVELSELRQQLQSASAELREARIEIETAQAETTTFRDRVAGSEQERIALQEQLTALEAENQRFISLNRYVENQAKERERKLASLGDDLEQTRAQLAAANQATKTAEANLSLQCAQFNRESAKLEKQLLSLQSRPNLQTALAELEERNNEMEELLRKKCVEIEENDDRALEMLKENKKLSTKVESLTRKVQNLQTKLAAAKAAMPKVAEHTVLSQSSPPHNRGQEASSSQLCSSGSPSVSTVVVTSGQQVGIPASSSITSAQESATVPPIFKARTPERPLIHPVATEAMAMTMATTSSIGKRRRADEDEQKLPAQLFTAESVPSHENRNNTPRVRRVLNGLQSGFTPKRNTNRRAASPSPRKPSPKKFALASAGGIPQHSSVIHDVTNSPHGLSGQSNKEKRSWLNKIRGGNTPHSMAGRQADGRPS